MKAVLQGVLAVLIASAWVALAVVNAMLVDPPRPAAAVAQVDDDEDSEDDEESEDDEGTGEGDDTGDEATDTAADDEEVEPPTTAIEVEGDEEEDAPPDIPPPGSVLVRALGEKPGAPQGLDRVAGVKVTASSASAGIKKKRISYDASQAVDGKLDTWWQENAEGDGQGQRLRLEWDGERPIATIWVVPGYMKKRADKFGDRWPLNNRLKGVVVRLEGGANHEVAFEDARGWHALDFTPPVVARWVEIEIASVWPGIDGSGARVHDSGVSEVRVWEGRR